MITMARRRQWMLPVVLALGILFSPFDLARAGTTAGTRAIMRDLELEALQEAMRWPSPDVGTVLGLAGPFVARQRHREAYAYFLERTRSHPDRPLFLALEGFFQARVAGEVSLFRRAVWVHEAVGPGPTATSSENWAA
jgi:hypothetical protein